MRVISVDGRGDLNGLVLFLCGVRVCEPAVESFGAVSGEVGRADWA